MTSQAYHSHDDQLVQDHDQVVVLESTLLEPEAGLAEPVADLAEPDTDQTGHEDPTSHLADPEALADHESAAAADHESAAAADRESAAASVSAYPGATTDGDDGADEPEMSDSSPGIPVLVSAASMAPEPVTESHLAVDTASAGGPWNEILAMFVDDPRASIERAASLVDVRVEALIQSVKERQRSMRSAWQADEAGTEELRVALQHYRTFWNSLDDLPAQD
jgi:hypothetical protein